VFFSVNDDASRPVAGLTTQNIQVFEDGNAKAINQLDEFTDVSDPIVFSLVMDYSVSVTDADLVNIENAAVTFVNGLFDQTNPLLNFGEIRKFARTSEIIQTFTSDENLILDGVLAPYPDRGITGTKIYDAMGLEIEEMVAFRNSTPGLPERSVLIVITDGQDDDSDFFDQDSVLAAAQGAGIQIVTVGFGDQVDLAPLFTLAIETNGLFFYAPTSAEIVDAINLVLDNLRSQYRLIYDSSGSGNHLVQVVVTSGGLTDSDAFAFACP
jgi:hypothetical protein